MRRARVGRVALTELSEEARKRPDAHHGRTRGTLARGAKDKDDCIERIDDLAGPSARPGPGGFDNRHARTPATAGLTWLLPFADSGKRG